MDQQPPRFCVQAEDVVLLALARRPLLCAEGALGESDEPRGLTGRPRSQPSYGESEAGAGTISWILDQLDGEGGGQIRARGDWVLNG
jgi:hypothetical protein